MSAGQLRKDSAVFDGRTDRLTMKHSGIEAVQLRWINNVLVFRTVQTKPKTTKISTGKPVANKTGCGDNYDNEATGNDPMDYSITEDSVTISKPVAICDSDNKAPIPNYTKKS
jgi:hypothetical protein